MLKKILQKWKWIVSICLIVGVSTVGYYTYSIYQFAHTISIADDTYHSPATDNEQATPVSIPKWDGKEPVHVLLMGTDTRDADSNGRSDSMMVATIDPVTKKAYIMSILRDTYVDIPGHGSSRLNAAYSYGGVKLAKETVSNLLGIPIDYYVTIDFEGFKTLVDTIGGVEIDVEKDMNYTDGGDQHRYDIHLTKGLQHLDGTHALQYVRFRHDATSDFTRTERQRKFLTALAAELQSSTSIVKLPSILSSIAPYLHTNLSLTDMIKLSSLGLDINLDKTEKLQIPPNHLLQEIKVKGASVIGVDNRKLHEYVQEQLSESNDN
ncbi:LCP family protein [Paenibacillus sp. KACC 21273]|uniref:LCP family protein n=1 Tax=Paenibacillus sp. KACC 21273 TaxID=3025665 RepID=UPI00236620D2|nr:LCP family protein [Paenibacillus sp. KACC 21273]WDF49144.1 LCP family protein [Paenibacillus sp. KACC 21273]